jgi:hypothetical protein
VEELRGALRADLNEGGEASGAGAVSRRRREQSSGRFGLFSYGEDGGTRSRRRIIIKCRVGRYSKEGVERGADVGRLVGDDSLWLLLFFKTHHPCCLGH